MSFNHEENPDREPSKSARKRAAKAVEELAKELADLPKSRFAGLQLPNDIHQGLELARTTRGHGSRKRQIKHLAGILRKEEELVEKLNNFLAGTHEHQYQKKKLLHTLESLRDGLCDPARFETTLAQAKEQFPALDANSINRLTRRVHTGKDRHAFREIFRLLKAAANGVPD
jgi:ribosome-associated protein